MEQSHTVQPKLTTDGLVLEIFTKKELISAPQTGTNNYFQELYRYTRLNSELSTILKFTKLPNTLLELSTVAHDFYARKHFTLPKEPLPIAELQALLRSLLGYSVTSLDEISSKVPLPNHQL